jgi:hypothetical protein
MTMWLLLCENTDMSALWAHRGLLARRVEPLEIVTSDLLAYSLRWEHRLARETVDSEVSLADGRTIRSSEIRGAVNRLQRVPARHLAGAAEADRAYAHQELTALMLSFLYSLPGPMLNRPVGLSPSGPWLHRSEWTHHAVEAGLPVAIYARTSDQPSEAEDGFPTTGRAALPIETIIVVGDGVVGRRAPSAVVEGSRRLAKRTAASLLGVQFSIDNSEWLFVGASPYPDLTMGGEPLLDLLGAALRGEHGS